MSKSVLGLLLLLFVTFQSKAERASLSRAEQPIFNIDNATANPGETVVIDFHVDDFTEITSAQFSVNWDPEVLEFKSIGNFNPDVNGLSSQNFNISSFIDQGKFTMIWFEGSVIPITLPDGSLFFTVEFEVIGDPCQSSLVAITDDPLEIEVAFDELQVGLVSNDGEVNIPGTGCTEDVHLIGNSVIGACGSNTCIQFTVENFISIVGMQFSLVYDPTILEFDRIQNFAPLTGFNKGSTHLVSPGVINVVWTDSNAENDTLPDGTILFEICFNVIGSGGQSSEITFGELPPVQFFDSDSNIFPSSITPAVITAQCELEGFALIASEECTQPNGNVCIDISVNDFDAIIAMQFSINWNPALFHFDHIEGFNLQDLDEDDFATPPDVAQGRLGILWFPDNTEPVSVPDNTIIFRLCLEAVGAAGTTSPITFTDTPTEIEIATEDSVLVFGLIHGEAEIKLNCDIIDTCALSYTLTPVSPNCPGQSNGSLNLSLNVGTCNCTPAFLWSFEGRTTEDLIGVPAGTYTVTITCGQQIVVATETITNPTSIGVTGTITNPIPVSASNGAINISVNGGMGPYTFQWNTNPVITTEDLINIPAGTYIVTITDSKGCTFISAPFIVGAEIAGTVTNASCAGMCNGSITANANFGVPPYTYLWSNAATTQTISNLCAGQYCVTITDSQNSTRTMCFTVTQPAPLNVSATITHDVNINCQGAIDLNVTGGVLPFSYQWSTPPGSTSSDITNLCAGQYCVTISYNLVCSLDTCFTITEGGISLNLVAAQFGNFQTSCTNSCDGEITSVIFGGTAPFTYHWSNNATTPDLNNLCPGTYSLTVTDAGGNTATAARTIAAPSPITLNFILTKPTDFTSANGAITVIPSGGNPGYTYVWTGPVTGNSASINNLPPGTYRIAVRDANGCEVFQNVLLFPEGPGTCYLALTIFTPNDDGKNDFFMITCVESSDNHLSVFNRNGGLVYETDDYQNNWTGVDADNEPLPDGGYLWVLEYQDLNGINQVLRGTVYLLRTAD